MESTTRTLANRAIEQDLLAPDALLEAPEPGAPPGYELVRHLGRGGCGDVYLCRDTRLDRPVAIKFLTDATRGDIERFRREARFTARLNDPAIVQVYELGESDGRPYIAMQYVDGGNLGVTTPDLPELVRIVREVARALRAAHAEGIVHRDIKPENILLGRDARPFLTDFGIARSLGGSLGETMSREGQIIGTPGLMAPEQARGEIQAIDARSDIYALGATLFCKLTGRYPFQATNLVDVLHAVIHQDPPMPRALNASVPRGLETIVLRCMRKCRDDRYQSVDEMIDDLDRFTAGNEPEPKSSAWFRRLVGQHESAPTLAPNDDLATDPFSSVGLEIVREIAAWDADLYRVSGSLTRSFTRLDQVRARLESILADRPDTAWARFYRGVVLFRRGRLHDAAEDMERAIDRVKDLAGAYFELGRLYLEIYLKEHRIARRHISQTGIEHGLTSARSRLDQAVVALSEAQRFPGEVPGWIEPYARAVGRLAETDFAGCISICREILAEDPDIESVWKLCGDAQRLAGDDPFESYDRALEVRRSYFEALFAKAEAHLADDHVAEARTALERAREIHPEFVEAIALLARTHLAEARATGYPAALERAHTVATEACGLDALSYDALVTLAEVALERGRREASDAHLAEAVTVLDRAEKLDGCVNRVNLLKATSLLERARLAHSAGAETRSGLEELMTFCEHQSAQVAENETWLTLRAEVERELAAS